MKDITEKEFSWLANYVKGNYGINLLEKKTLVTVRLNNFLTQNNIKDFSELCNIIASDTTGNKITEFLDKLTTNHTFFMREEEHFTYFKNTIMPYLKLKNAESKDLRIWSAGCSTGEEPYTLAMIISDFLGFESALWDYKILATDISKRVIDIAQKGIYTEEQIEPLNESWKKRYLKKLYHNKYEITDSIKNEVIFRIFNLMNTKLPFKKKFDVIFCRNVMIYFDNETKAELVNRFYQHTESGGYLFIGHSEALNRDKTKYRYVMPALYRKE